MRLKTTNWPRPTLVFLGILLSFLALPPARSDVVGSKHDLSTGGGGMWGATDEDQVCVFCHTPHSASPAVPLWNREIRTATYNLYSSETLDAVPGQPQGVSLLCLSCHDGVTALNSLVNPSPTNPTMSGGFDQLGDVYYPGSPYGYVVNIGGNYPANGNVNDLTNDHPISFTFDSTVVAEDNQLRLPPNGDPVRLLGAGADQMECATCHDPHDTTNEPFLVKSNAGSGICMTCHIK